MKSTSCSGWLPALAIARQFEGGEGLIDRTRHGGLDGGAGLGVVDLFRGFQHAAQGQQAVGGRRRGPLLRQLVGEGQIAGEDVGIDPQRGGAEGSAAGLDAEGDLAAVEPGLGGGLGVALEGVEAGRAAETDLQIAAVDRAGLDRQDQSPEAPSARPKPVMPEMAVIGRGPFEECG